MACALSTTAHADPYTLSNGSGDGSVTVGVDGFGSFGSSVGDNATNAFYNPVGEIDTAGTVYESGLFILGPESWLTSGSIGSVGGNLPNPTVTGDSLNASSMFSHGFLDFTLTQRLVESFDGPDRVGSALEQTYLIRNTAEVPNTFSLTRYVDGDLGFDNSISDGGGRFNINNNQILFETDAASGSAASTTFVGITAGFSGPIDGAPFNSFEIDSFSGLRSKIEQGFALDNMVAGDTDFDGFIDDPYDVTLALQSRVTVPAMTTVTYTTRTLFGNAVPPSPGSSEVLPLLPGNNEAPFVFDITPPETGEPVWIDPEVAVGYEFEVLSGSPISGVNLPSMGVVPQNGQYEVQAWENGMFVSLGMVDPGGTLDFDPSVTLFRIVGIDVELELDPENPLAFPTGISFAEAIPTTLSMTPLTVELIPEPAAALLLIAGLACVGGRRRG